MDSVDRKALLQEFKFLTGLLVKHEASKKEEKSAIQQNNRNVLSQQLSDQPHSYTLVQNPTQLQISVDKYTFKKTNSLNAHNQRIVLNKNFNAKLKLPKNQTSKCISSVVKNDLKITALHIPAPKRTVLCSEKKFGNISTVAVPPDNSDKIHSHSQFMEELESLTELLKKRNSRNKLLNFTAQNKSFVQNKLPLYANKNDNPKQETTFPKSKCQIVYPQKVVDNNTSSFSNSRKLSKIHFSKLNTKSGCSSNFSLSKHFNHSIYSYKKDNSSSLSSKINSASLSTIENKKQAQTLVTRPTLYSHTRKVIYSKLTEQNPHLPSTASVLKPLSSDKQKLNIKSNSSNCAVSSKNVLYKKSTRMKSSLLKAKTPNVSKLCKVSKLKPANTSYIKINKQMITPSKSVRKSLFSTKKTRRKVSTKYKVINKSVTPCSNKVLSSLSNSVSNENSPLAIDESESFFQKLNDTTIDKLEQDLLAISTALTSTPLSSEISVNNVPQHLQTELNLTLPPKKMSVKRSKPRISKYKIVNSGAHCNYATKKNITNLQIAKNVSYSKLSLVNKHLQPIHVLSPLKQEKSVLVKRLFKSKNTIINKNTSPISYSAKMIKSKYFSLNKRKLSTWQKCTMHTQTPSHHQRNKGYYLRAKLPTSYQTARTVYHPKVSRKRLKYNYSDLNRQFSKNSSGNKYKRKLKNGFVTSPVIFIHGMKYSLNSSGKTLKKLPAKDHAVERSRKLVIGGKALTKSETSAKVAPTTSYIASRVLNRSINRIISASSKKSLTKVNRYCMFYNRFGRCNKGIKCTYIHDPSKIAVCTRFLRGTCKIEGCPFSHEVAPGKMAICSFFLVGSCEKKNCPYRHEKLLPGTELCKAFVQGYCPDGKECNKAHILICPKYIQGDCDKGDFCAYPHPPKKVKKNVQKEEECEAKKPDDVLLDKVCRYFLQTEECLSDNATNHFVPKQRRRLEEQPSFIPLCDDSISDNN